LVQALASYCGRSVLERYGRADVLVPPPAALLGVLPPPGVGPQAMLGHTGDAPLKCRCAACAPSAGASPSRPRHYPLPPSSTMLFYTADAAAGTVPSTRFHLWTVVLRDPGSVLVSRPAVMPCSSPPGVGPQACRQTHGVWCSPRCLRAFSWQAGASLVSRPAALSCSSALRIGAQAALILPGYAL